MLGTCRPGCFPAPHLRARSGTVLLPVATLHDLVRAEGDAALADVPGLLERLDIPQIGRLWPEALVRIDR